jgi:polar amino acid transport system substrate-binding protein
MKLRKLAVGTLALVVAAGLMLGCSQAGAAKAGAQDVSTLQKVIQNKKITVGCILSFPPFGFKDTSGVAQGYDVDIARSIAKALNAEIEIVDLTSDARIPSLETGKVDLVIGNFTRNTTRAQKIDFTDPYVVAGERLLVKKGSPIKSIKDLKGQKVGVTKGSTNADIVKNLVPEAVITYFETSADALTAVKNGQAATFIEDSNFQQYQAKLNPELMVVGDSFVSLEYNGFGVKKGDQAWLNWLNLYIFNSNVGGENSAFYQKWFGEPLPF